MKHITDESRRRLLKRVTLSVALIPFAGLPFRAAVAVRIAIVAVSAAEIEGTSNCSLVSCKRLLSLSRSQLDCRLAPVLCN